MTYLSALLHRARIFCTRQAATLENSPRARQALSWWILLLGLLLFVTLQSLLILPPLWGRALPPEVDDSLAFLVRTAELQECFFQDCPALKDLRQEFSEPSTDPEVHRQLELASFPFPFYHPLFSLLLLGVSRFTGDLLNAYRVVWSLSPVLFGVGLACFLTSLWGRTAAGIALGFFAFKVLPDSGLHYLTPSNLALGLALLMWARLIRCKGDAPWTLGLGTLALATIHPLGGIYALIGFGVAGLAAEDHLPRRIKWVMGACLLVLGGALLLAAFLKKPSVFNLGETLGTIFRQGPVGVFRAAAANIAGITAELARLKTGLFGFGILFLLMATLGYLTAPAPRRVIVRRFLALYLLVLLGSLFHRAPLSSPGDLFLRMWIPWLAVFVGALAQGIIYILHQNLLLWGRYQEGQQSFEGQGLAAAWPLLALATLLGFVGMTLASGGEQLAATREYMRQRQALSFASRQPQLLLEESQPGDRVIYTAIMPMAYYFVQGALQRGALYYHPAFREWEAMKKWPSRPEIRFLVTYNPLVYHPALVGLDEKNQCISSPPFYYSPLGRQRRFEPLGRGGYLEASDFAWLEIEPQQDVLPAPLRVWVKNPGKPVELQCQALAGPDRGRAKWSVKKTVPGEWSGWVEFVLPPPQDIRGYRLVFPQGHDQLLVGGLTWGDSPHRWPWASKAVVTGMAKDPAVGRVAFSFDVASLLPPGLEGVKATVLDDHGASVLLKLDRER